MFNSQDFNVLKAICGSTPPCGPPKLAYKHMLLPAEACKTRTLVCSLQMIKQGSPGQATFKDHITAIILFTSNKADQMHHCWQPCCQSCLQLGPTNHMLQTYKPVAHTHFVATLAGYSSYSSLCLTIDIKDMSLMLADGDVWWWGSLWLSHGIHSEWWLGSVAPALRYQANVAIPGHYAGCTDSFSMVLVASHK